MVFGELKPALTSVGSRSKTAWIVSKRVPSARIGYVEIAPADSRRVGFSYSP